MKLRVPWVTLSLAAVATLLFLVPGAAPALQFEHTAVAHGELWRGLTGHLVHFNADHLMWDVFALLLLGAWAEFVSRRGMVVTTVLAAVAISVMVFFLQPQLTTYRGLSGLDSAMIGLTIAELLRSARRERDPWTAAVAGISALLFLGKSLYECTSGGTLFAQASGDFVAVPAAHLVGFLCGLIASGITRRGSLEGRAPWLNAYSACTITKSSTWRLQ